MSTWDAARAASRRQLPKPRKMMGPVGEHQPAGQVGQCSAQEPDGTVWARACQFCGYHVCSCKPVEVKPTCMYCGAVQEDRGMKTRMMCEQCSASTRTAMIHPSFERKACCGALVKDFCGCMPGSVDVAGLEKLRAEWEQKVADEAARHIRHHLELQERWLEALYK